MHSRSTRHKTAGFSLLEVLVAGTIFSFGLAGFSGLLLCSVAGASEARIEAAATLAASSLSEHVRLNPAARDRFPDPPAVVSTICEGVTVCTPEQQADYDFKLWRAELADSIRNARGLVCRDGTPQDGGEGHALCDGAGPLVIKIIWPGLLPGPSGGVQWHVHATEVF